MAAFPLASPLGVQGFTGADISFVRDASDSTIYWSCQLLSGGGQAVLQQLLNGTAVRVPLEKQVSGRGQLGIMSGQLWLGAWNEWESPRRGWMIPVPQCKQPEPLGGSDLRVPELQSLVQILTTRVTALEERVDFLAQRPDALSARYIEALERLCILLKI